MRLADDDDRDAVMALQQRAFAPCEDILGVTPLPLLVPAEELFEDYEVWLLEDDARLLGVLVLEPRAEDMLVFSLATDPEAQRRGLGRLMLETAELRARQFGHKALRLHLEASLGDLISWFGRRGYSVERQEAISDRELTHMMKGLP